MRGGEDLGSMGASLLPSGAIWSPTVLTVQLPFGYFQSPFLRYNCSLDISNHRFDGTNVLWIFPTTVLTVQLPFGYLLRLALI